MRNALGPVSKSFAELWAFAAAASILLISTLARAQAQPPPEVSLVIAAEPRAADDLELVIRELLARLAVTVQVSQVARIDVHEIASPPPMTRPLRNPRPRRGRRCGSIPRWRHAIRCASC